MSASRRHRYARSSTASVTQLLTDSCSSFIHRLTTRVRGPSQTLDRDGLRNRIEDKYGPTTARQRIQKKYEKPDSNGCENTNGTLSDNPRLSLFKYSESDSRGKSGLGRTSLKEREESRRSRRREILSGLERRQKTDSENKRAGLFSEDYYSPLGVTRSRLEDKYSDVLDKYVKKKRDLRKADSPVESSFALKKSATTASVVLAEKAYPFVASTVVGAREAREARDKTPFRAAANESVKFPSRGNRKSELESRSACKKVRSLRKDGSSSETLEKPFFRLCPVEIDTESARQQENRKTVKKLKEACIVDEAISEREARRKEIQSLINKYVMLDEAYCKLDKKVKSKTKEMTVKRAVPAQSLAKRRQRLGVSKPFLDPKQNPGLNLLFLLNNSGSDNYKSGFDPLQADSCSKS